MAAPSECIVCFLLRHDPEIKVILNKDCGDFTRAKLMMERHPEFKVAPTSVFNHRKREHEKMKLIENMGGEMSWKTYFDVLKKKGLKDLERSKEKISIRTMMDIRKMELEEERLKLQASQVKAKVGLMSDFMMMAMYAGQAPKKEEKEVIDVQPTDQRAIADSN